MIFYLLLMPLYAAISALIGVYSISSATAIQNQVILICLNCFPVWLIISRFSRNIVFDTILANIVGAVSYLSIILLFDSRLHLSAANYCGLALAFIGLILMKIETKKHPA